VEHTLAKGDAAVLTIFAADPYSRESLRVAPGQVYQFTCDRQQRWWDLFIPTGPEGFFNPLALLPGLRVKGVRCFCLCGVYDRQDETAFPIGSGRELVVPRGGNLAFFANDARNFYGNNRGSVQLRVRRVS
jgi:hypothetical protein